MMQEDKTDRLTVRRALISSWRKEEAVALARRLKRLGVEITASGGTAAALENAGLKATRLETLTGFNDLLKGRVKTLHPAVYAAILARPGDPDDTADLERLGMAVFDLVAVDLYPYPPDDAGGDADAAVELIDIGGVSLLRAAAKNFARVVVACGAESFAEVADILEAGGGATGIGERRRLALRAFSYTSRYDGSIAAGFAGGGTGVAGESLALSLLKERPLRYGENPHQGAALFVLASGERTGIPAARKLGGKKLSFNNLLDLDIALRLPGEFQQPAAAILKHTTPCGVGLGADINEAFLNARSTDPQSAFGSIVGLNRVVDAATAGSIREGFVEVVAAPGYDDDALALLKKSKNLRIMEYPNGETLGELDTRSVLGGMLVQEHDSGFPELDELRSVTSREPTDAQLEALKFAWRVVRYVKSNAIVIADRQRTIGIGAGQMSRVDAAHIAVWKAGQAGLQTKGAVAASDAFFPFRDGLDLLADAGVEAVIQPGGSVRDQEVITAAEERGLAMLFTGRRHFRH